MKIYVSFIVIGLGIGWLAGLSVSPVISTIISALLALIASLMAFLTNVNIKKSDKERLFDNWNNSIFLMASLMLGIIFGSSLGIFAREHNIFGPSLKEVRVIEREALKKDIESISSILKIYLEGEKEKIILQEFIHKRILPFTSKASISSSDQLNRQYGRSELNSGYKMELCKFLLSQGNRVVSVIQINSDKEEYRKLLSLLNQMKEEQLSKDEITKKIQQHLEGNCI